MDTLMRDPELALTDQVNFCNPDFMKPTSEAVLSGGLNINITPSVDFFGKQRDIPITIGAVEGAQCIAKRNMGGSPQSIKPDLPAVYKLNQNYPNPFLNYTTIRYQIPGTNKVDVRIDIISIDGKLIKTLVNDNRVPGYYTVTWDGLGNNQRRVPSGNYLYILRSGKFKDIKLITILK
jgi:hypothetical protein